MLYKTQTDGLFLFFYMGLYLLYSFHADEECCIILMSGHLIMYQRYFPFLSSYTK